VRAPFRSDKAFFAEKLPANDLIVLVDSPAGDDALFKANAAVINVLN
jgi:hypothetical protein